VLQAISKLFPEHLPPLYTNDQNVEALKLLLISGLALRQAATASFRYSLK
jgi:hypothetical protein